DMAAISSQTSHFAARCAYSQLIFWILGGILPFLGVTPTVDEVIPAAQWAIECPQPLKQTRPSLPMARKGVTCSFSSPAQTAADPAVRLRIPRVEAGVEQPLDVGLAVLEMSFRQVVDLERVLFQHGVDAVLRFAEMHQRQTARVGWVRRAAAHED